MVLTLPVMALFLVYCGCLVLCNWLWSIRFAEMERLIVGQDQIIQAQRDTIDELHDAVFSIAQDERVITSVSRVIH